MSAKFAFLTSVRFWKLVIAGIVYALFQAGIIDGSIFGMIEFWCLGSVAVRTVDRFGETVGK